MELTWPAVSHTSKAMSPREVWKNNLDTSAPMLAAKNISMETLGDEWNMNVEREMILTNIFPSELSSNVPFNVGGLSSGTITYHKNLEGSSGGLFLRRY